MTHREDTHARPAGGAAAAPPVERGLVIALPFLVAGLVGALPMLFVPQAWSLFGRFVSHLSLLTALAVALSFRIAPLAFEGWFGWTGWSSTARRMAGAIVLVVLVTGVVGLVTLATTAALGLQPSLQFLQLLSALDIAWVVAAATIGALLLRDRTTSLVAGVIVGTMCVLAIWNYLRVVGFTPDGGWRLDGGELLRLVIPADVIVAVVVAAVLVIGVRRSS